MLLNAFGWWKMSQIAYIAALTLFGLGTIALAGGAVTATRTRPDHPATVVPQPATTKVPQAV
jgi:hypothetical protein